MKKGSLLLATAIAVALAVALPAATAFATEPDTFIDSGPGNGAVSDTASATFTFHSSDLATDKYICQLDHVVIQGGCTSPYTTPALAAGPHEFSVAASSSGVTDSSPAVADWTIDLTPPTLQLPVQIATGPFKLDKKGFLAIPVTCPATSPGGCSGTMSVSDGKANFSDLSIIIIKKLFSKGRPTGTIEFSAHPGQTVYLRVRVHDKTGKSGGASGRGAFSAKSRSQSTGGHVDLVVTQPSVTPGSPPIVTSAKVIYRNH